MQPRDLAMPISPSLLPSLRLPPLGKKSENIWDNKYNIKESDYYNLAFMRKNWVRKVKILTEPTSECARFDYFFQIFSSTTPRLLMGKPIYALGLWSRLVTHSELVRKAETNWNELRQHCLIRDGNWYLSQTYQMIFAIDQPVRRPRPKTGFLHLTHLYL